MFVIVADDVITERHVCDILGVGTASIFAGARHESALTEQFWDNSLQAATERFQRAYLAGFSGLRWKCPRKQPEKWGWAAPASTRSWTAWE